MRISDWSSDVCSSDLLTANHRHCTVLSVDIAMHHLVTVSLKEHSGHRNSKASEFQAIVLTIFRPQDEHVVAILVRVRELPVAGDHLLRHRSLVPLWAH